MKPCNKGWDDPLNREGRCCCNCKFQFKLLHKGKIIEQVVDTSNNPVYVCTGLGDSIAITSYTEHSMCEMHTFKGEDE